jgi:geranylgeranyl pyrophosphate synthase
LQFGRFFQLRDDYLDYFDAARLKKKGLQDFTNGIVTRPLLQLLSSAGKQEQAAIKAAWNAGSRRAVTGEQQLVQRLMEKYQVAAQCAAELEELQQQILAKLAALPGESARKIITGEFEKILAVRAA